MGGDVGRIWEEKNEGKPLPNILYEKKNFNKDNNDSEKQGAWSVDQAQSFIRDGLPRSAKHIHACVCHDNCYLSFQTEWQLSDNIISFPTPRSSHWLRAAINCLSAWSSLCSQ